MIALQFHCHTRPPSAARVEIEIDQTLLVYELESTLNWVMGSTDRGSKPIVIPWTWSHTADFAITARHSDVIICGYSGCYFDYLTQPTWSDGSSFMDITGHGPDQDLQGPGSLVLPRDVTCRFTAKIISY
jgi:hypothetical protein